MSHDTSNVSLKITPPCFYELAAEPTSILLFWQWWQRDSGQTSREFSMQNNKMGESPMDCDTRWGQREVRIVLAIESLGR